MLSPTDHRAVAAIAQITLRNTLHHLNPTIEPPPLNPAQLLHAATILAGACLRTGKIDRDAVILTLMETDDACFLSQNVLGPNTPAFFDSILTALANETA